MVQIHASTVRYLFEPTNFHRNAGLGESAHADSPEPSLLAYTLYGCR